MDFLQYLDLSFYKEIAVINEEHNIFLVQNIKSNKIYIKKLAHVYNKSIYEYLKNNPIEGIPTILVLFEENSVLTIIEEYISGNSLSDKINEGSLSENSIKKYISELCVILEKLHSSSPPIVHRDIKPSNILITYSDHVVLLDFNAAKYKKVLEESDTMLIGTQGYAAPEQYGFGSSTPQTDIYAVGILLKELQQSLKINTHTFDGIIKKCTKLKPSERFKNVSSILYAINKRKKFIVKNNETDSKKYVTDSSQYKKFLPPGFRNNNPFHMILAVLGYIIIIICAFSYEPTKVKNNPSADLWLNRVFIVMALFGIVAALNNYIGISTKFMPLCRNSSRNLRCIGYILFSFILFFIAVFCLVIIEDVFNIN